MFKTLFKGNEKPENEFEKFLLEEETIDRIFGLVDKIVATNKRLIFKDVNLSLKEKKSKEVVFINYEKIDGLSIIYSTMTLTPFIVAIKTRGYKHDITLPDEAACIEFINYITKK